MGYLNIIPENQSRINKEARKEWKRKKAERIHINNMKAKAENSFKGLKVVNFKRIINVKCRVDDESYLVHVSVNKNGAIYDVTMDGFGRVPNLYYRFYGRPFVYDVVKEWIKYEFQD